MVNYGDDMEAGSEGYSRSARIVRQGDPVTPLRFVPGFHVVRRLLPIKREKRPFAKLASYHGPLYNSPAGLNRLCP